MSLHAYAPESIREFLDVLAVMPVTIDKARASHTVSASVPLALVGPLRDTARDLGLSFETGRARGAKGVQIVVKAPSNW